MAASDLQKRCGLIMGLRGLLMLLAGLYAVIWPATAIFVLVMVGAFVLIIDGVLGVWALTFGGAKTGDAADWLAGGDFSRQKLMPTVFALDLTKLG